MPLPTGGLLALALRVHDQGALDIIAARLNHRPRRVFDWATPAEAYAAQHTASGSTIPSLELTP